MRNLNLLRLGSVYLSGAMTLLQFYYQKIHFNSENLGHISLVLMLASTMDLGIYYDFISEKVFGFKRKYVYSLIYSTCLSILIFFYFDWLLAAVFFSFAVLPTWYLRFKAEYKELLLYYFINISILFLGINFKIDTIWIYCIRGIASNILCFPRVLVYTKEFVWSSFSYNTSWLYTVVSTLVSNIGVILSVSSDFGTDNINYYYDKLGLLFFIIFQFVLRSKGEIRLIKLNHHILLFLYLTSLLLLFNKYYILSRYVSDICVVWMSLELIRNDKFIFLIKCTFLALLFSVFSILIFKERNPWSVNAIASVAMTFILIVKNRTYVLPFVRWGVKN